MWLFSCLCTCAFFVLCCQGDFWGTNLISWSCSLFFFFKPKSYFRQNELVYVVYLSLTQRIKSLKMGQQKPQYVFFQILFDKVHFQLIETPYRYGIPPKCKKMLRPKDSTMTICCMTMWYWDSIFLIFWQIFEKIAVNFCVKRGKKSDQREILPR